MRPTEWFMLALGALAGLWELAALAFPAHLRLISPTMRSNGQRWLWEVALWGLLAGHFYGARLSGMPRWSPLVLCSLFLVVLGRDLFIGSRTTPEVAFVVLILFLALGALLWGQS